MYVLFTPIARFTFQYNFMHYAQFFQELYWVLALRVSFFILLTKNRLVTTGKRFQIQLPEAVAPFKYNPKKKQSFR